MSSITDTFDRPDGTLGANWTAIRGEPWAIASTAAHPATPDNESAATYSGVAWDADHSAEVVFGALTANVYVGVMVRCDAGRYLAFYVDATGDRYFFIFDNGSYGDSFNLAAFVPEPGGVLRLAVAGTTATATYNGTFVGEATGLTLTGGAPGLAAYGSGAGTTAASWTGDGAQTAPPTEHVVRLLARRGPAQVTASATEQAPSQVTARFTRQPIVTTGTIAQRAPSPVTVQVTRQPVLVRAGVLAQAAQVVRLLARRGATRLAAAISSGAHAVRLIARRGPIRIATPTPPAPSGATAVAVRARRGAVRTSASLAAVVASGVRLLVRRGPVRVRALVAQAAAALGRLRAVLAADTTRATLTGASIQAVLANDTTHAGLAADGTRAVLMSDRIRATIEVEA